MKIDIPLKQTKPAIHVKMKSLFLYFAFPQIYNDWIFMLYNHYDLNHDCNTRKYKI